MNPAPNPEFPSFPGFDTCAYPGDQRMRAWKAASPYVFTAYYLPSHCHEERSWTGHRAALVAMGWNVVPVYVGRQVAGFSSCKLNSLSAGGGAADALSGAKSATTEGFAKGSYVYLDVEYSDSFPANLHDYLYAWTTSLVAQGFSPGVYCHKHNAPDVRSTMLAALARTPALKPRFWIAGGVPSRFMIGKSHPADSGIAFADMWQCPRSVTRRYGGFTIKIDENLSALDDPARPEAVPVLT